MTDGETPAEATYRIAFGNRLRALRQSRGMSQEQLAELAGIHRTYVSGIERGRRNLGLDNIFALAQALDVPPFRLFEFGES